MRRLPLSALSAPTLSAAILPLLVLPVLGLLATPAAAASPQEAACEITVRGQRFDGPCRFTPHKGGSFDVQMTDRTAIAGATGLSLDVIARGKGEVRGVTAAGVNSRWGEVTRQAGDGACWQGADFTICVRASDEARPAAIATVFAGRCHMDLCTWIEQSAARTVGKGSAAVPGRRAEVAERYAESEHPGGSYPDGPPAGLDWTQPVTVGYFCSTERPAVGDPHGAWTVLPLPEVFGYSESTTQAYLHACHPGAGDNPYETPARLGYRKGQPAVEAYPSFDSLIAE